MGKGVVMGIWDIGGEGGNIGDEGTLLEGPGGHKMFD